MVGGPNVTCFALVKILSFARLNSPAYLRARFYRFYPPGVPRDHLSTLSPRGTGIWTPDGLPLVDRVRQEAVEQLFKGYEPQDR